MAARRGSLPTISSLNCIVSQPGWSVKREPSAIRKEATNFRVRPGQPWVGMVAKAVLLLKMVRLWSFRMARMYSPRSASGSAKRRR